MTAFPENSVTKTLSYLRQKASEMGCNTCFDGSMIEVMEMNEKGSNGVLACLCKANTPCPCSGAVKEIERDGSCYCEIFRRV